jgi:hypothetical protein
MEYAKIREAQTRDVHHTGEENGPEEESGKPLTTQNPMGTPLKNLEN